VKRQRREKEGEADSSRLLRSRARIVPAGAWGKGLPHGVVVRLAACEVASFLMVLKAPRWDD